MEAPKKLSYQFENKSDGLYLHLKGEDNEINIQDILEFIEARKITEVNLVNIKNALKTNTMLRLGESIGFSGKESAKYKVSDDSMTVEAKFFPPFVNGHYMDEKEITEELMNQGITAGIDTKAIRCFLRERDYSKTYILAVGQPPEEGKDAVLTYHFDVEHTSKPKINEDGIVDYHELDNISHVKVNEVVASIEKEVYGKPGYDVYGKVIAPRKVSTKRFRYGVNLKVSDDGTKLYSLVAGHVTLDGDRVSVASTYEVVADVDVSTGNIDYDGNVSVKGNVRAGFIIRATGNVEVRGIVEGATIIAGGDIILQRGMQGMRKGTLVAGGNIVAKFLEQVYSVNANGNIEVAAIMNTNVMAKGTVTVQGRNGLIVGGEVRSYKMISAKTIGSTMGTATNLIVGVDPNLSAEIEKMKEEIIELNKEREKLLQIISILQKRQEEGIELESDKVALLRKSVVSMAEIDEHLKKLRNEFNQKTKLVSEVTDARIRVYGTIYPGVKLMFGETYIFLKEEKTYCQFIKEHGEIKSVLL